MRTIPITPIPVAALLNPVEERAFTILTITGMVLAGLYVYFVTMSILNVMAHTEAQQKAHITQSAIAELEDEYFSLTSGLSPHGGIALGLVPSGHTQYVTRPSAVGMVEANHPL